MTNEIRETISLLIAAGHVGKILAISQTNVSLVYFKIKILLMIYTRHVFARGRSARRVGVSGT